MRKTCVAALALACLLLFAACSQNSPPPSAPSIQGPTMSEIASLQRDMEDIYSKVQEVDRLEEGSSEAASSGDPAAGNSE